MNPSPAISVILSAYNGSAYLRQAIESILDQTFPDFEFILVDDGSTDSTFAIFSEYHDPRIICFQNEDNCGLTVSLNRALAVSRGRYIARQDADDFSCRERLQRQLQFMESHPQTGLLGTGSIWLDEAEGTEWHRSPLTENTQLQPALLIDNYFDHSSVMFRRECLQEAGGKYSEEYRYSQDYDLWLRMAEACDIANIPEALYVHRIHPAMISTSKQAEQKSAMERIRVDCLNRRLKSGLNWLFHKSDGRQDWMAKRSRQEISTRFLWWASGLLKEFLGYKICFLAISWIADPKNLALYRYFGGVWQRKTAG